MSSLFAGCDRHEVGDLIKQVGGDLKIFWGVCTEHPQESVVQCAEVVSASGAAAGRQPEDDAAPVTGILMSGEQACRDETIHQDGGRRCCEADPPGQLNGADRGPVFGDFSDNDERGDVAAAQRVLLAEPVPHLGEGPGEAAQGNHEAVGVVFGHDPSVTPRDSLDNLSFGVVESRPAPLGGHMSTPAPNFSNPQEYRDSNRRMAESIVTAEPAPYLDGGYVRRVIDIRGRRSGQVHAVPIAVITLDGRNYVVSPTRQRNWVQNLNADPTCTVRSRDSREPCRVTPVEDPQRVADVVSTYVKLMNAPWAVAQFPFPADANHTQIAMAADRVAVFELQSSDTEPHG